MRGKSGVGAKMDSMDLEREKGITIQSAATYCEWDGYVINLIDTPGHVDFTIEVERALRVLDGAVLVLCGTSGVQSQSYTVDRQMRRYNVPRLAFINKLDRAGADPARVTDQLKEKLRHNTITMQLPIGDEADFEGIIDLIKMKAYYFDGDNGEDIREEEIPADRLEEAKTARHDMIASIADHDDAIADKFLAEQEPSIEELHAAHPPRDHRAQDDAGVHRLRLQEQGRPAAARRREHVPARTRRRSRTSPSIRTRRRRRSSSSPIPRSRSSAWRSSSRTGATGSSRTCASTRGRSTKGDFIVNNSDNRSASRCRGSCACTRTR